VWPRIGVEAGQAVGRKHAAHSVAQRHQLRAVAGWLGLLPLLWPLLWPLLPLLLGLPLCLLPLLALHLGLPLLPSLLASPRLLLLTRLAASPRGTSLAAAVTGCQH